MKLTVCLLVFLVLSCELSSIVRASARYEKGLVMGILLLGNYRNPERPSGRHPHPPHPGLPRFSVKTQNVCNLLF